MVFMNGYEGKIGIQERKGEASPRDKALWVASHRDFLH